MASLLVDDIKRTLKYFENHKVITHLSQDEVGNVDHSGR